MPSAESLAVDQSRLLILNKLIQKTERIDLQICFLFNF